MDSLKELIFYLSAQKIQHIRVVGEGVGDENMSDELYRKILDGSIENDEQASEYFFKKNAQYKPYRQLKGRIYRDLINKIYLIDLSGNNFTAFQRALWDIPKDLSVANMLTSRGIHHTASEIALKVLSKARKYGFYKLMHESAEILKNYYGTINKDKKLYNKYKSIYYDAYEKHLLDQKATDSYIELLFFYSEKKNIESVQQHALSLFEPLSDQLQTSDNPKFQFFTRLIRLAAHNAVFEHEKVKEITTRDIKYFLEHHSGYNTALNFLKIQKANACLRLGLIDEGLYTIQSGLAFVKKSQANWFALKHLEFLLYMHDKQYQKALSIYQEVKSNRTKSMIPEYMKENWRIAQAYLELLKEAGKLEQDKQRRFRLNRFLNEVPISQKERKGANLNVLTAKFLFLLIRERHDELIDSREAWTVYCSRNFKHIENGRGNLALKMLLKIPQCGFHAKRVEAHTKDMVKRLAQMPYGQIGKNYQQEVMKYEDVWELAMSRL
ncbi:MAG: hypothetical protein AAF849_02895 [Bacteroidota bacterium]